MTLRNLSIIIPLGPEEDQLAELLGDLALFAQETEIILVSCGDGPLPELSSKRSELSYKLPDNMTYITSPQGRAIQQNAGARAATGDFLWFLHADSRVTKQALLALSISLQQAPDALHYFHLKFKKDGPAGMWLNEWGARFRSQILGLPFGDQGFCLRKDNFITIGGFPEDVAYGEDHVLVWHLRQAGLKLRGTGAALPTSARKYVTHGWGALTFKYQWRWMVQAFPEFIKFIRRY